MGVLKIDDNSAGKGKTRETFDLSLNSARNNEGQPSSIVSHNLQENELLECLTNVPGLGELYRQLSGVESSEMLAKAILRAVQQFHEMTIEQFITLVSRALLERMTPPENGDIKAERSITDFNRPTTSVQGIVKQLQDWTTERHPKKHIEPIKYVDELRDAVDLPHTVNAPTASHDALVYTLAHDLPIGDMLSSAQLRTLDAMSPREFLTHILQDLSLEERETLLMDERQRRRTFLVNWPHDGNQSGEKMAQAGFYCLDDNDKVQCVFCRGRLQKWEQEDIPMTEHARSFSFCRFIKGLDCGNREYRSNSLSAEDLANINFFGNNETDCNVLGICTNRAARTMYSSTDARLATFARWPLRNLVSPEDLSVAGFYYTGFDDTVICFFCGSRLSNWEEGDNPWIEHARWYSDCPFLRQMKGDNFVSQFQFVTRKLKQKATIEGQKKGKYDVDSNLKHQEMIKVCENLGHDQRIIELAIRNHDGPYASVGELLEDIYAIEENYVIENERAEVGLVLTTAAERNRSTAIKQPASSQNLAYDNKKYEGEQVPMLKCIRCYRESRQIVHAEYIGLPCGHLIYCQKCQEEVGKTREGNSVVRCPYKDCGAPLRGTMRCYVA